MARQDRTWFRLDANFTRDEKVTDAGWPAAELYLAGLGYLKLSASKDGRLSRQSVAKLGVAQWERKANRLIKAGLWVDVDPDTYIVPAWPSWIQEAESTARVREWRDRQRLQGDVT